MFVHRFKRMIPPLHDMAVMFAPGRRGLEPLHCGSNDTNRFNSSQKQQHGGANDFQIAKHNANLIHARSTITYRRCFSSSSVAPRNSHPTNITERDARNKGIFSKIWDRYSFQGQQKRILLGERLFRSAQHRANDPRWYTEGRIPFEFRPRHSMLTMHVWFLHKRLLIDRVDPHLALLVQEELFDILWNDTRARIRAEGVNELTVNKHLKDVQQITFLHLTHYDHAFQEFANNDGRRFEELAGAIWIHVLNRDEETYNDQLKRLAAYVEYQYINLVHGIPDDYFWEGRIPWGDLPVFSDMKDNDGKALDPVTSASGLERLPEAWIKTLTDAGDTYYWNTETNITSWEKPI